MENTDHIALTLSQGSELSAAVGSSTNRKSLRRTWNQLPRCQRNLIILGTTAICITFFLFLSVDQILTDGDQKLTPSGFFPYYNGREVAATDSHTEKHKGVNLAEKLLSKENPQQNRLSNHELKEAEINNVVESPKEEKSELVDPNKNEAIQDAVNLPAPDVENAKEVLIVAETQNEKINVEQLEVNNNNNIESPDKENPLIDLESIIKNPKLLPGPKSIAVEDFLNQLESPIDAQKQHFHGANNERQAAVVTAFLHSWKGYKAYAWGHDNLKPTAMGSYDWFGLGLTIVDSLDTMYIMGLEDEFQEARDWVNDKLSFDVNKDVNLFEVTIRVLGGLLAAYHLSGDKIFLQKSIELGNRLLPCFNSPSGIPYSDVNLASMTAHSPKWSPDSSTSEVTTIQLEFRDLSRSTNISIYEKVVQTVNERVHALEKSHGLVPIFINANSGKFRNYATISLGARGDSYYEYLLKQWVQTGRKENDDLIQDYMTAIDGVLTQLMRSTPKEKHVYIGELINGKDFKPKMDHLTCYLPGTLLLGHKYGMPDSHLKLATDLLETCFQTYMKQPTHLAPEITYFALTSKEEHDIYVKQNDAHNLLRPEFIESLYYFYALTGNHTYQDMGWEIFQAFEKYTKVPNGYTSIGNVKNVLHTRPRDIMESFWLGETLKYFYLLFSDNRNEIDLDKWVFNTEAHPLPIRRH